MSLQFELKIEEAWVDADARRRAALQVSRTSEGFTSAYPIELDVAIG